MKINYLSIAIVIMFIFFGFQFIGKGTESEKLKVENTPAALPPESVEIKSSQPEGELVSIDSKSDEINVENSVVNNEISALKKYKIDSSHNDFQRLYNKYLTEKGIFKELGTVYTYKQEGEESYFIAIPPALSLLISEDPDQYIELKVEEFNLIDEDYVDNWGGDFEDFVVNYHYCKQSRCLLRAQHNSVNSAREAINKFILSHPELEVQYMSMASGDIVVTYQKKT
ncbi:MULTISPECIES: hypothetical protein [Pseudomonadati]|uniref:DUF4852 domain-containing protein n=1 Tax=Shewanella aestuarii TaxID=1028752 RepID=A0ABT0L454_9GAMM|nr:hypothetical protein [Shewanella aestuarii]MCL1118478.1 hypothetical protein [Shewanella aestuarii]GGN82718.1 hypothetical protein GCM10009193_30150 [Shewanella aestuarii]